MRHRALFAKPRPQTLGPCFVQSQEGRRVSGLGKSIGGAHHQQSQLGDVAHFGVREGVCKVYPSSSVFAPVSVKGLAVPNVEASALRPRDAKGSQHHRRAAHARQQALHSSKHLGSGKVGLDQGGGGEKGRIQQYRRMVVPQVQPTPQQVGGKGGVRDSQCEEPRSETGAFGWTCLELQPTVKHVRDALRLGHRGGWTRQGGRCSVATIKVKGRGEAMSHGRVCVVIEQSEDQRQNLIH